ncbi:probable serine/threonine-protein kinase nek3 isoform X1 [Daphnia carinata]|uniref:probable serine/threonine-protein kinase nek3 isoform X1 n=1 Tax=Daphnia carinata TaxID=120202 RepID=UPI0025805A63|nr:probable serine/threonine-protein kinase nek3 isoform X1 [Daphnia carinata]
MYKLFNRGAVETPKTLPPPKVAALVNVEEEPPVQMILLPCPICFRTFKVESLERHKNVCQKVGTKKRKVFDSAKQRLEDLPDVPKVSLSPQQQQQKVLSSPLVRRSMLDTSTLSKKIPPWKEKHLSLIKTVRQARGADSNRCPCCERNFGDKAFDRHVEWCREQQSRIPKSPTNSEAKERWEARTKYQAPLLRRSIRSKYSPTRSLFSTSGSPAPSVDGRLTAPDCAQSLSGSRASLDSRASSTYSYQPTSTFSRSYNNYNNYSNNNNNNNNNSISSQKKNLYNSNTLGRASGSAFLRHSNDRRSLRVSPPSPPPIRRVVEPPPVRRVVDPPVAVTLTPLNNNRTSALRASLRMKNPFTSMASSFQSNPTPTKPTVVRQPTLVAPASPSAATKRPTVLQLFTSAFSRPSPVAPAKNRGNTATSSLTVGQLGQGRRSEPEGVESKLMTGSCYNYSVPSKMKSSRSTPNLGKRLVAGTCILPNKIRPLTYTKQARRFGSDNYNPYLSAERQMAELFDDRPKKEQLTKEHKMTDDLTPTSTSSISNTSTTTNQPDDTASMEQLEQDLKSILSEISQLGQTSTHERETSWQNKKSAAMTPSVRLSTAGNNPSTISPSTTCVAADGQSMEEESKPVPKFCHSCGASYPERHTVKFCCHCGARRLYV